MRMACPVGSTSARAAGGLEHAELRLQLRRRAGGRRRTRRGPASGSYPFAARAEILEPRQRLDRRAGVRAVSSVAMAVGSSVAGLSGWRSMTRVGLRHPAFGSCGSTAIPSSSSCSCGQLDRRAGHESSPTWFLGNACVSRIRGSSSSAISEPVDARGDAAVRRRAHRERVEQEAELLPLLLRPDARGTRRPAAGARARGSGRSRRRARSRCRRGRRRPRARGAGSVVEELERVVGRARERVVRRLSTSRSARRTRPRPCRRSRGTPSATRRSARARGRAGGAAAPSTFATIARLVGDEQQRVARPTPAPRAGLGEELRDRRRDLAVRAEDDVGEPLRAPRLRLRPRAPASSARENSFGTRDVADGRRVREDAELGAARVARSPPGSPCSKRRSGRSMPKRSIASS